MPVGDRAAQFSPFAALTGYGDAVKKTAEKNEQQVAREIQRLNRGEKPEPVSADERFRMIRTHYERMLAWKPEYIAVREMRKHIGWYIHGLRGAAQVRAEINRAGTPEEVRTVLTRFRETLGNGEEAS